MAKTTKASVSSIISPPPPCGSTLLWLLAYLYNSQILSNTLSTVRNRKCSLLGVAHLLSVSYHHKKDTVSIYLSFSASLNSRLDKNLTKSFYHVCYIHLLMIDRFVPNYLAVQHNTHHFYS